jgi:methyl-accepting chemotaxis protein
MGEAMPKFNSEPAKPEEGELGFKVEDKRHIDLDKINEEIKAEKEKKKFDAMTPEQREEWEYNRDKERGYKIADKRFQSQPADIGEVRKNAEEKKVSEIRESINNLPQNKPSEIPTVPESEFYAWKTRLDGFKNELKGIEDKFRSAKISSRTILGYGEISGELKNFQKKFEEFAEKELSRTTVPVKREVLVDEFSKMTQKINDMKDKIAGSGVGKKRNIFRRMFGL